jgi:hypothetical protein
VNSRFVLFEAGAYISRLGKSLQVKFPMSDKTPTFERPTEEERAEFRKRMSEMMAARLDMFAENADKYAKVLGAFRKALVKSGFSRQESMQIVLKFAEQTGGRPMHGGGWWRWRKRSE